MRSGLLVAIAAVALLGAMSRATTGADQADRRIVALRSEQVSWFTPPYYKDGRQRAHLLGDSDQGGTWVDRVKIPGGGRVLAHTHPMDEVLTVIEGTWYVGEGERFDRTKLKGYPAGVLLSSRRASLTSWPRQTAS